MCHPSGVSPLQTGTPDACPSARVQGIGLEFPRRAIQGFTQNEADRSAPHLPCHQMLGEAESHHSAVQLSKQNLSEAQGDARLLIEFRCSLGSAPSVSDPTLCIPSRDLISPHLPGAPGPLASSAPRNKRL